MIPGAGGYSLQSTDTTTQTAESEAKADQKSGSGQRGIFVNLASGGSKLTPTYSASDGVSQWVWVGLGAVALVGLWIWKRK